MVTLAGCGSSATSGKNLEMADFTQAFEAVGVTVDTSEKPEFAMIGAEDGVIFYVDDNPVKIYKYGSKADLEKAKKDFSFMAECPVNGTFVLETSQDKAKEIFNSVK